MKDGLYTEMRLWILPGVGAGGWAAIVDVGILKVWSAGAGELTLRIWPPTGLGTRLGPEEMR